MRYDKMAFPGYSHTEYHHSGSKEIYQNGMGLRDYFAAQALTSMGPHLLVYAEDDGYIAHIAETSYRYADAMMEARAKKEGRN